MSVPVALDELRDEVARSGAVAFLLTVSDGTSPHAVSAAPTWDGDVLVVEAGRTTARNASAAPSVTLLWPRSGEDYSLIVDGSAVVDADAGTVRITPTRGILHRSVLASAPDGHTDGDAPRCITVL
jgi:hypothetical protein